MLCVASGWRIAYRLRPTLVLLFGGWDAELSALSGAGRHVFFHREFAGTAFEYFGPVCGCVARGGAGVEAGKAFSYRRLGGFAQSSTRGLVAAARRLRFLESHEASAAYGNGVFGSMPSATTSTMRAMSIMCIGTLYLQSLVVVNFCFQGQ
jgi:hypothetical protein